MDADSFFLSYPEIRDATGLRYDVRGHSNKSQLFKIETFIDKQTKYLEFLTNLSVANNGLELIFRSDCMANPMLWYLMGATEGHRAEPISSGEIRELLQRWHTRVQDTGTFVMPYAEDAEYIGTSAYFYVKQFNQARFFEAEPASVLRFQELLATAVETGFELSTPADVAAADMRRLPNPGIARIENGVAWHGGTAKAWANTVYSRILDPVCRAVFDGIKAVGKAQDRDVNDLEGALRQALEKVTSAYVSDSRWPPDPTSPGRFNVREALDDLYAANDALRKAMHEGACADQRGLYSPELMLSQIKAIDEELMALKYFGE